MHSAEESPHNQPVDPERMTINQETDKELLRLLKAYREKGHDSEKPSQEQQELREALYLLIDTLAGINRYTANPDSRNKRGRLALARGVSHRAEELANRMQEKLDNNAIRYGQYLAKWREDGGASIATYIWNMGGNIAKTMGREAVEEWLRVDKVINKSKRNIALGGDKEDETGEGAKVAEVALRKEADRLIKEFKKDIKDDPTRQPPYLPSVELKSISDYEPGDGYGADEGPPTAMPEELIASIESPLASALRVRPLLEILRVVGNNMKGKTVVVKGVETHLTVDHRNIWFAFLALTPEQHKYLGASIEELAEKKGWPKSSVRKWLADGFEFFRKHRLFEECCDLFLSNRESKHMDAKQLAEARAKAKMLLLGEVPRYSDKIEEEENARDLFRKTIHQWIEKYGDA